MELGGFEPPTPSLRKMWSNRCDQGKRLAPAYVGRACGTSVVRCGETWRVLRRRGSGPHRRPDCPVQHSCVWSSFAASGPGASRKREGLHYRGASSKCIEDGTASIRLTQKGECLMVCEIAG